MKNIKGNLLDSELKFIAHGCNAHGVMGSGVARYVREKYPNVYEKYAKSCDYYKDRKLEILGRHFTYRENEDAPFIINCITQVDFGTRQAPARYTAVVNSIQDFLSERHLYWNELGYSPMALLELNDDVAALEMERNMNSIAIPEIGCGLGGLEWEIMEKLLLELEEKHNIEFWVYRL